MKLVWFIKRKHRETVRRLFCGALVVVYLLVTGAAKRIGRAIALRLAATCPEKVDRLIRSFYEIHGAHLRDYGDSMKI